MSTLRKRKFADAALADCHVTATATVRCDTFVFTMPHFLFQSTGLDPEGVALRASEGLAAVDFLMPGYFVWGKIIEALADIGYETSNLVRLLCSERRGHLSPGRPTYFELVVQRADTSATKSPDTFSDECPARSTSCGSGGGTRGAPEDADWQTSAAPAFIGPKGPSFLQKDKANKKPGSL